MKVLLINGSPHKDGNTAMALAEVARTLESDGVETVTKWIGTKAVQGCIGCYKCAELGRCVFHDDLYESLLPLLSEIDGIVIGSPVYYAGPSGSLCALLDRLFYSAGKQLAYKPAAAVVVCRRGGASAAFDRLNKYFTILSMPVVSSQYWNMAYGRAPGEVAQDGEGMQTMRTLAHNMAWMLDSLKKNGPHPREKPWSGPISYADKNQELFAEAAQHIGITIDIMEPHAVEQISLDILDVPAVSFA